MVSHPLAVGFHGCDKAVAERVVCHREELLSSNQPWEWLGHGIYFWEDSHARAMRWAEDLASKGKVDCPAVIGAIIDLGNCLNLIDAEALSLVRAAHEAYRTICQASGAKAARNRGPELAARFLDCAVMETLHQLREKEGRRPFDTVRGFFVEGKPLYPDAGLRELDHIQICVRAPKQIVGYFWPRGI